MNSFFPRTHVRGVISGIRHQFSRNINNNKYEYRLSEKNTSALQSDLKSWYELYFLPFLLVFNSVGGKNSLEFLTSRILKQLFR